MTVALSHCRQAVVMDEPSILALVALIVAAAAALIAFAQVLQQYFSTGQLIRLCDSVVYSYLPGQGRRLWHASQFRFRVVYSLPLISIHSDYWTSVSLSITSFSTAHRPADRLLSPYSTDQSEEDVDPSLKQTPLWRHLLRKFKNAVGIHEEKHRQQALYWPSPGEAAWAAFFRPMLLCCNNILVYERADRDADRCPSDLPSVPMPVTARDVVLLALATGMEPVRDEQQILSMNGPTGSITTSNHPTIGNLLHFESRPLIPDPLLSELFGLGLYGYLSLAWSRRVLGIVSVASACYDLSARRHVRHLAESWSPDEAGQPAPEIYQLSPDELRYTCRRPEIGNQAQQRSSSATKESQLGATPFCIPRRIHDGDWRITKLHTDTSANVEGRKSGLLDADGQQGANSSPRTSSLPIGLNSSNGITIERWEQSRDLHRQRREYVDKEVKFETDAKHSEGNEIYLALEEYSNEAGVNQEDQFKRSAHQRKRAQRERIPTEDVHLGNVSWFWFCQMNILQGFWVTPWYDADFYVLSEQAHDSGAVTVVIECLLGLLTHDSIAFVSHSDQWNASVREWLADAKATWPAYAENACGGTICTGLYVTTELTCFADPIPVLQLIGNYHTQVRPQIGKSPELVAQRTHELMSIDSWLSLIGRMPEISDGRCNLLRHLPNIINQFYTKFHDAFESLSLSADDGGYAEILRLTVKVMQFLEEERLSDAEVLYFLVAALRTVKVAICIANGTNSNPVLDILRTEHRAHIV